MTRQWRIVHVALLAAVAFGCGGSKKKGSICVAAQCSSGICFAGEECVSLTCQSTTCTGSQVCIAFSTGEERCVDESQLTRAGSEDVLVSRDTSGEDGQTSIDTQSEDAQLPDTGPLKLSASCGDLGSSVFIEGVANACPISFVGGEGSYSVTILNDGNFDGASLALSQSPGNLPGLATFSGICSETSSGTVTLEVRDGKGDTSNVSCKPKCVQPLDHVLPTIPLTKLGDPVGPVSVPIIGGNLDVTIAVTAPFGVDTGLSITPDNAKRQYVVSGTCLKGGQHTAAITVTDTAAPCYQQSVKFTIAVTCRLPELSLSCETTEPWIEGLPRTQSPLSYSGNWPSPPTSSDSLALITSDPPFMLGVTSVNTVGTPNLSGSVDLGGTCHLPGSYTTNFGALTDAGNIVKNDAGDPVTASCSVNCKAQKIACPPEWTFPEGVSSMEFELAFRGVEIRQDNSFNRDVKMRLFDASDTTFQTPLDYLTASVGGFSPIYAATMPFPFTDPDFPAATSDVDGGTLGLILTNSGSIPAGDYLVELKTVSEDTNNAPGTLIDNTTICPLRVRATAIQCPSYAYGPFWKQQGTNAQVSILSNDGVFGPGDTLSLVAQIPASSITTAIGPLTRNDAQSTSTRDVFDISGTCDKSTRDFILVFEHTYTNADAQTVSETHYCKLGCTDGVVD